jgi:protein gp37
MGALSNIEWTDASWTPIRARNLKTGKIGWHCEHSTTGCEFCYAEGMNKRLGTGLPFKPGHRKDVEIFLDEKMLLEPLRWKKPRMVFVCSMTDLFADFVPDEWIDRVFAVMALCPQHTFQVLTKRAERMRDYLINPPLHNGIELAAEGIKYGVAALGGKHILPRLPLRNVWLGTSCERQEEADERWPFVANTPAAIRFISYEPALGPLSIRDLYPVPDWLICGGESGPNARPMHPQWARDIRDQCQAAGVAFFFKQWGGYTPSQFLKRRRDMIALDHIGAVVHAPEIVGPGQTVMDRVGKKAAGRLLDGREWNEFPNAAKAVEAA